MRITRRALLAAAALPLGAAASPPIRIGVLRYGTVSWEVDVIRTHGLDAAAGIAIAPVELAAAQAAQVALQAGQVDMIVVDWLWVARQRGTGADWTSIPFSDAVGALIAPADFADPRHRRPEGTCTRHRRQSARQELAHSPRVCHTAPRHRPGRTREQDLWPAAIADRTDEGRTA